MTLDAQIESLLFYRAEPISRAELASLLGVSEEAVVEALTMLEAKLADRGVRLISSEDAVALVTAPEAALMIDRLRADEFAHDIGKAALETLSIILYRAPVSRTTIDYIRGVNSQSILRSLAIRGLIEKAPSTERSRTTAYRPTLELLAHLGLTRLEELPNYRKTREQLALSETTH